MLKNLPLPCASAGRRQWFYPYEHRLSSSLTSLGLPILPGIFDFQGLLALVFIVGSASLIAEERWLIVQILVYTCATYTLRLRAT